MSAAPASGERTRLIRLIHVGKRELNLDDADYRAVLQRFGKASSSADLSIPALRDVLEHLKKSGFQVRPKSPGKASAKPSRPQADDAQSRKIRALWLELHAAGKVRDPSEAALAAFVRRMAKVDALQWLNSTQAAKVIEELKKWLNRP